MNVTEAINTFEFNYGDSDAVREAGEVVDLEIQRLQKIITEALQDVEDGESGHAQQTLMRATPEIFSGTREALRRLASVSDD